MGSEVSQERLNAALGKANKLEWLLRVSRKLEHRVSTLQERDAIVLLKAVEKLL